MNFPLGGALFKKYLYQAYNTSDKVFVDRIKSV